MKKEKIDVNADTEIPALTAWESILWDYAAGCKVEPEYRNAIVNNPFEQPTIQEMKRLMTLLRDEEQAKAEFKLNQQKRVAKYDDNNKIAAEMLKSDLFEPISHLNQTSTLTIEQKYEIIVELTKIAEALATKLTVELFAES